MPAPQPYLEDDDRIVLLRSLLNNRAWTGILLPALEQKKREQLFALINPSQKRKDNTPDDFLRGAISTLVWLEKLPTTELTRALRANENGDDDESDFG